ncbi:MAG: L-rhamnose isomerase [Spirochaetes bacterium]|nr:L-rhamnose isomerase [Spirochaetota bacterium]
MESRNDTETAAFAVEKVYSLAKAAYAAFGIDTDNAIKAASNIPISIHCWQGDDVTGFEGAAGLSGGILATGNYPGRARNGDELRADAEFAFSLIPGEKRFSLHALYAETDGKKVQRDELAPEHFKKWMDWSAAKKINLDFNPSFFSHPLSHAGTLCCADKNTRDFWIRHGKASRNIASAFGANQGSHAVNNIWIPDGSKDIPADRLSPRQRLLDALDEIFSAKASAGVLTDTLESKLFGIGSESYVAGSHEFYLGYAASKGIGLCMDTGHFHPTETIADKISATLLFVPSLLIHFSRGIRWDSDHVTIFSDDLRDVCREIVRQNCPQRINIALDYFDASINRIAAWVIGTRSLRKGFLEAFLEPAALLRDAENSGRNHERLALMEEFKTLPFGAVWDKLCLDAGTPVGSGWLGSVGEYEKTALAGRK